MKARLIATGERAPSWVAQGFAEYQKRLSHWLPFELVEVTPGLRGKNRDAQRAIEDEGQRVLAALPKHAHIIALEVTGKQHSSEQLAQRLEYWRGQGRDLAFLIGGPEGHAPEVLAAAHETWSIGPLTLPHMMARLIVAEQLYRAAAMLANH
ncbi:MAG: 23S rRNA (pseudouridine(1915)-N(3))-methyltransferase RlmH, partial [Pseudoxanthomonas sp.]